MTYANKRHLKTHEIKVRFDTDAIALVDAVANLTRRQRAVLVREYALREIKRRLSEELPKTKPHGRP